MVRRIARWTLRVLLALVALIALALLAAVVVLQTSWGREQVRARIQATLEPYFPAGARVGRVEGNVLGDFSLREIVLHDLEGRPAVRIDRIDLNVALLALFSSEARLEKLIVEGAVVDVHQHDQDPPNLATMFVPSPDPMQFHLVIERLEVRAADLTVVRDGRTEHIDDVTVLGRVGLRQDGTLRGRADVTAHWRERALPISLIADVAVDAAGVVDVSKAEVVAGDVRLEATGVRIGAGNDIQGALHVEAPRGALERLVPEATLTPAAISLDAAVLSFGEDGMRAALRGSYGSSTFLGALSGRRSEELWSIGGTIMVRGADARDVIATLPATSIDTTSVIALQIDTSAGLRGVTGTIGVDGRGTVDALVFEKVTAGVTLAAGEARVSAEARGDGNTWLRTSGVVTVTETERGRDVDLRDGRLVVHSDALDKAAQGRVAIAGTLDADLSISGRLVGAENATPQIAVRGTIGGERLRREDVRVRELDVTLALDGIPERPGGTASVRVRGARVGTVLMPDLDATARGTIGGSFAVTVRADDRTREVRGRVAGTLTLPRRGDTLAALDLASFDVTAKTARVSGRGGRIVLGEDQIVIRGLRGSTAGGTFAIDAVAPRQDPTALTGVITAEGIDLATLHGVPGWPPTMRGTLDAQLTIERGHARARIALADDELGSVSGVVDITLPRRRADPEAWKALDRRALRELQLDLRAIDLAAIGTLIALETPIEGRADGSVRIGTASPGASLSLRGVMTEGMPAPADIVLWLDLDDPTLTTLDMTTTLRGLGTARVSGAVRAPRRVLDVAAWQRLGVDAIERVHVQVDRLVIDRRLAARAGAPDLRGAVSVDLRAGRGLAGLEGTIAAHALCAGPLVEPATVTLELEGDRGSMRGELRVTLGGATVVTATLSTPRDLVGMVMARQDLAAMPITGTLSLVDLDLRRFARSFGVRGAPTGRVGGTVSVTGTLAAPTGKATITVEQLGARQPRGGGALRGGLRHLAIDATYARGKVHVEASGRQDDGGRLDLVADARLDALEAAEARLVARDVELQPLARLVPDVLFGLSGKLNANLRLRGTDPATATLLGTLAIRDGTLPIDDVVGVLRDTAIDVTFEPSRVRAKATGSVEAGTIELEAAATLDGLLPRRGTLVATATGLELITASAPRVNGTLTAEVERAGDRWKVTAAVRRASVTSRVTSGRELHPSAMPNDLVFASIAPGAATPVPPARRVTDFIGEPPSKPVVDIVLRVYGVTVDTPLLRGDVGGRLDISLGDDGAIIDGKLEIQRGDVMVLERRYRLSRAIVSFDGGLDPLLDLQLERELPELTLLASVTGRASDPQLELTSDPATFTQGQLLAFALSDTASAAGSETSDAASNLFASVASQAIVGAIAPILPVHLDLISYEPASASSSRAFVFGRWLTRRLLVLYRNRAEARADENVNEAEIEYWLGRRVVLEGIAGDRGILGADLLWTRRW